MARQMIESRMKQKIEQQGKIVCASLDVDEMLVFKMITEKSFNFMGTKFHSLMMMDMFVDI